MTFEAQILKGTHALQPNIETKLMKLFLQVTFHSIIAVILAIPGLILLDPCSPPFLLSMTEYCASVTWTGSIGFQHFAFLFDTWMIIHVTMGGSMEIIYILFAGIVSMLNYFAELKR
ncbi:hypothetical protein Fcan01_18641 [Folsomia candida]|uniref:Uncharacterized protein n=1 Tax=Folsomia candida TaxID=158441 RepID=A0A226DNR3_FOLCA|nr:hypothetical protein Fcan01_18641 [Folsomia candida]